MQVFLVVVDIEVVEPGAAREVFESCSVEVLAADVDVLNEWNAVLRYTPQEMTKEVRIQLYESIAINSVGQAAWKAPIT